MVAASIVAGVLLASCTGGTPGGSVDSSPGPADLAEPGDLAPPADLDCRRIVYSCFVTDPPACDECACGYGLSPCTNVGATCTYVQDQFGQNYTFTAECGSDGSLHCLSGPCWGPPVDMGTGD